MRLCPRQSYETKQFLERFFENQKFLVETQEFNTFMVLSGQVSYYQL